MLTNELPKVSVYIAASLDGFIATKDNDLSWLDMVKVDNEDYGYADFMQSVDCLLIGRNTYDIVQTFPEWPYDGKKVAVLTHRPLMPLKDEFPVSGTMFTVLSDLAKEGVKSVYLDGGSAIQEGLRAGVVSTITLSIIPILLGGGIPLFGELGTLRYLRLKSTRAFPSGLAQLRYEVAPGEPTL